MMWRSLRAYLPAVIRHWWVLVAGILAAAVGLVADIRSNFALPVSVWAIAFVAALVVAQFLAFHDLRRRYEGVHGDASPRIEADRSPRPDLDADVEEAGPMDHRLVIVNSGDVVLHDVNWELVGQPAGWTLMEQGLPKPWPELGPGKTIRLPIVFGMPGAPTIELRLTAVAAGTPQEWTHVLTIY